MVKNFVVLAKILLSENIYCKDATIFMARRLHGSNGFPRIINIIYFLIRVIRGLLFFVCSHGLRYELFRLVIRNKKIITSNILGLLLFHS